LKKLGIYALDTMTDTQEEMIALDLWKQGLFDEGRTLPEMAKLASLGIAYCASDEYCQSRDVCGEHCLCVRQSCPSPEHYEMYKRLRKFYKKEMAKRVFAKTVKRQKETEND